MYRLLQALCCSNWSYVTLVSLVSLSGCGNEPSSIPHGSGGQADTGNSASGGQASGGAPAASGGDASSGGGENAGGNNGDLLIDDFEDHDTTPMVGTVWYKYDDNDNGGLSTSALSLPQVGYESDGSLLYDYSFDQGTLDYDPYVGVGVNLEVDGNVFDLSAYSGIRYFYKGGAHTVRLETSEVEDYDFYGVQIAASNNWTSVELPFALFTQEGWGQPVTFNPASVREIAFHIKGSTGEQASFALDDLYISAGKIPDFTLVSHDPAPPNLDVIDPSTLESPLQQLALDHLSRGANLDSWLEAGRFDGFDYDESYVQKLAAAGFTSLRLPIDLDLYVESVSGAGSDLQLELQDDLFLVLDSFEQWTADSGMSLTIDYHQYDRSLDFAKQNTQDLTVALWGAVAEHFADNTREDLFFELLNEPELSVSGTAPTSAQWTSLAEKMIAAIREHDTNRVILFGDVEFYGITPLSKREPLSDDKVIYVFHFYDPFLFSHQGTSWTDLLPVHDVPYPYAKERWPESGTELGISKLLPSWVLSLVNDYYKQGNKNQMFNRIAEAKQWAIDHNVPVICNEFGIYDAVSAPSDRVAYYTDLIDIFAEQEIPWQIWFRIMDEEGQVIPEYRKAFHLDE